MRDHRRRVCRKAGGEKEWLLVERLQCRNEECRRMHTALPDILVPYKHYESGLIEDVIEDVVTEDDPETEDHPCRMTMERWKMWLTGCMAAIEGQIRAAAERILDLKEEFLRSRESLFEELRRRISPGWLKAVVRIVYNSGGCIKI